MENDRCANSLIASQRRLCSCRILCNDRLFSLTVCEIASRVELMCCELIELEDPDAPPSEALLEDPDAWPSEALLEGRDASRPSAALLEDRDAWPGGVEDALDDKGEARAGGIDSTMFGTLRLGGSPDSSKAMIPKARGGLLKQSRDDCFRHLLRVKNVFKFKFRMYSMSQSIQTPVKVTSALH